MMQIRRVCALALTLCPAAGFSTAYDVATTNGIITGHTAPNSNNTIEFLGIPYAQPPVGDLRFAAPLPPVTNGSFVAAEWGYDCPQISGQTADFPDFTPQAQQIIDAFGGPGSTQQSEDCLTLNVWAPSLQTAQNKQPVLVFFHGGRFSIGNANSPFYKGSRFSEATGAVIVTLTYRLGVLGFPGAPGNIQNLGLRDQRRAIEWVQENIAGFGGDSSKITIFGQSSGGVAADWWTFAYKENPIVNGIISESGNAFSFGMNSREQQTNNWHNVSATVGCNSSIDAIECVRGKDWEDILAAASRLPAAPGGNPIRTTPPFYPTIDNETVFSGYASLLEGGNFARIPQLLGYNDYEPGYYVVPAFSRGVNTTGLQRDALLAESFTCPHDYEARIRSSLNIPVWQYRYFGDWVNTRLYPNSGAYHGTEMQMLFGNSQDVSGIAPTADQKRLTEIIQSAWVAFARNPERGLSQLGWPEYEAGEKTLIRLGFANSPEPDIVRAEIYAGECEGVIFGGS